MRLLSTSYALPSFALISLPLPIPPCSHLLTSPLLPLRIMSCSHIRHQCSQFRSFLLFALSLSLSLLSSFIPFFSTATPVCLTLTFILFFRSSVCLFSPLQYSAATSACIGGHFDFYALSPSKGAR